jgi:hypothetical protein
MIQAAQIYQVYSTVTVLLEKMFIIAKLAKNAKKSHFGSPHTRIGSVRVW